MSRDEEDDIPHMRVMPVKARLAYVIPLSILVGVTATATVYGVWLLGLISGTAALFVASRYTREFDRRKQQLKLDILYGRENKDW